MGIGVAPGAGLARHVTGLGVGVGAAGAGGVEAFSAWQMSGMCVRKSVLSGRPLSALLCSALLRSARLGGLLGEMIVVHLFVGTVHFK